MANAPKTSTTTTEPPEPEEESYLEGIAKPLGEMVVMLESSSTIYGIVRKSRANTPQSDYFRIQFKGVAIIAGKQWLLLDPEANNYSNTTNGAWVKVDHPSQRVLFGPRTGITCAEKYQASGLEAYLFAQCIAWAKNLYPHYGMIPGGFSLSSKGSMEERQQRNLFYAAQGFDFDWLDDEQRTGRYSKEKVGKLLGVWDNKQVHEVGADSLLSIIARQDKQRDEQESRLNALQTSYSSQQAQLKKERNTNQTLLGVAVLMGLVGLMFAIGIF